MLFKVLTPMSVLDRLRAIGLQQDRFDEQLVEEEHSRIKGLLSRSFGESVSSYVQQRKSILKDSRKQNFSGSQNYAEQYINNLEQLDGALRPRVHFSE